jgi:hypothetical protein
MAAASAANCAGHAAAHDARRVASGSASHRLKALRWKLERFAAIVTPDPIFAAAAMNDHWRCTAH